MNTVSLTRFGRLHARFKSADFNFVAKDLGRQYNGIKINLTKSTSIKCTIESNTVSKPEVTLSNGTVKKFMKIKNMNTNYHFVFDGNFFVDGSKNFKPSQYYKDAAIFLQVQGNFAIGDIIDVVLSMNIETFTATTYQDLANQLSTSKNVRLVEWPTTPPDQPDVPLTISGELLGGDDFPDPSESLVGEDMSVCYQYVTDDLIGNTYSSNIVYDWDWKNGPNHWVPRLNYLR